MSDDIVLFAADGPTTPEAAETRLVVEEMGEETALAPELAAVVAGLEARWPTAGGGDDHPWALLPLPTTMTDGMIGLSIVVSGIDDAMEEILELAEEHDVSVYDPQNGELTLSPQERWAQLRAAMVEQDEFDRGAVELTPAVSELLRFCVLRVLSVDQPALTYFTVDPGRGCAYFPVLSPTIRDEVLTLVEAVGDEDDARTGRFLFLRVERRDDGNINLNRRYESLPDYWPHPEQLTIPVDALRSELGRRALEYVPTWAGLLDDL